MEDGILDASFEKIDSMTEADSSSSSTLAPNRPSTSSSSTPTPTSKSSKSSSTPYRSTRFRAPTTPKAPKLSHKPRGFVYNLFRWPLLLWVGTIILLELLGYILIRSIVASYESASKRSHRTLRKARNFQEWRAIGEEIDRQHGREAWKGIDEFPFYDSALVASVTDSLLEKMQEGDSTGVARVLLEGCKNNLGGIENEQLYSYTHVGTKHLVEEHYHTVCAALDFLVERGDLPRATQAELFRKLGKAYGRTALCLSGGASFGYYHLGVIKCLLENGIMPKVISGTSAGSLISSFLSVRTDEELLALLTPELHQRFKANDEGLLITMTRFLKEGVMFDLGRWEKKMQEHITKGNTTFLEAYQQTGRILNISVAAEEKFSPPLLLNYKTTPNVVIWSAVLASAAVPGILHAAELKAKRPDGSLEPYHLVGKRWRDGVLRADIPYTGLKHLFGISYTVVSQVNPHVIPFFYENRGSGGLPTLHRRGEGWRGGFLFSMLEDFLRLDMRKWVQFLHNLNLLPRVLGQDWSMIFLQNFTGNVTIMPKFNLWDFARTIIDPDEPAMAHYISAGERNTWPKVSMITNRLRVEQKLESLRQLFPFEGLPERSSLNLID